MSDSIEKIKWRCRRGMLELDLILGRFVDNHYEGLSEKSKEEFKQLLEIEDTELFAWLLGHQKPQTPEFDNILQMVQQQYK